MFLINKRKEHFFYKCSFWRRRSTARFSSSSEPSTEAKVEYIEIHPLYREEKAQFLKNMTIIFRRIGCLRGYIVYGNPTFFEEFVSVIFLIKMPIPKQFNHIILHAIIGLRRCS